MEYYSEKKFEKLVHLVGFIIRIYHDAQSPERQIIDQFVTTITAHSTVPRSFRTDRY